VVLVEVTLAVGGREGKHTHSGELIGRILEGELTLEQEGLPTRVYRAGEAGVIDGGRVHEGINKGKVPLKVFATFVVPKGKPLTTQLDETASTP
jgi:quercetin dioxygenase-like cupin family protein